MSAITQSQLLQTITTILTSSNTPRFHALNAYIPHLTESLLISIFSSKSLNSQPTTLLSFFQWSQTHTPSLTQSPALLLTLVPSLLRHNKFSDVKSLLVSFIASDRQNKLHQALLHPDHTLPRPSRALLDTSIGAYIESGKPHLAVQIFNKMKRHQFRPNLLTCNTLLNALVRFPSTHTISMSQGIFKDMIKLGVSPNVNTFNILMRGYCFENKFKDAFELLSKMSEFNCLPDNVSYNTLLDALCKKGQLTEARNLLMPNRNTYNVLVCGYCKLGWLKEAAKIIELMTQNNLLPDIWTYNMLISGFCKEGRIEEAFRLRDEMERLKLLPDVITYNTLINGCFDIGNSTEAFKLIDEMNEKGLKQNEVTHNILVKWFCKEGNMDEACDTVQKMEESGTSPDCVTYNTLINGFCKAGKIDEAFRMMGEMNRKGLKMDTFTSILFYVCCVSKISLMRHISCLTVRVGEVILSMRSVLEH
ncbi:hypothetical protein G4B88_002190 [Cannabis sativa]|uniref:Pentatricopeptide repeat-containing protein n=1 Tax=Cannabis sativa TaxID=3483 RepID=A0A7J6E0Z3_CANSA|nr:hypothetical protein G4B88_002190 [Cannabis sativa]